MNLNKPKIKREKLRVIFKHQVRKPGKIADFRIDNVLVGPKHKRKVGRPKRIKSPDEMIRTQGKPQKEVLIEKELTNPVGRPRFRLNEEELKLKAIEDAKIKKKKDEEEEERKRQERINFRRNGRR